MTSRVHNSARGSVISDCLVILLYSCLYFSHTAAIIDEDLLRYERIKKKGYVRVVTNKGQLNLELHADMVTIATLNYADMVTMVTLNS